MQFWKFFLVGLNLEKKNTFTFWRCNLNQPTPSVFFEDPKIYKKGLCQAVLPCGHFLGSSLVPIDSLVTSTRQGNSKRRLEEAWRIMGTKRLSVS